MVVFEEKLLIRGPPIVRSSLPLTDNAESRTDSASSRCRFMRQSYWFPASSLAYWGLSPEIGDRRRSSRSAGAAA